MSFDAPDSVKAAMVQAIADNRSHYLQTAGVPAAAGADRREAAREERHPGRATRKRCWSPTAGSTALYILFRALLEPGDEVHHSGSRVAAGRRQHPRGARRSGRLPAARSRGWRSTSTSSASKITPKTRVIYLNSPQNPTGGVLTRADLERIAAMAREREPVGDLRRGVRGRGVRRRAREHRVAAWHVRAHDPALHVQQVATR